MLFMDDPMYEQGWEDAKGYYREVFHMLLLDFGYMGELKVTYEMINEIFHEIPEDAMKLVHKAILARSQS